MAYLYIHLRVKKKHIMPAIPPIDIYERIHMCIARNSQPPTQQTEVVVCDTALEGNGLGGCDGWGGK